MNEPGYRYTTLKLRVRWDPESQDHPLNWNYETLLETEAQLLDFEDDKETDDRQG